MTCVALANAQGGRIFIGYDDKKKAPLPEQHVTPDEVNEAVTKLRSLCFNVGLVASEICTDYKNERWEYGLMDYISPFFSISEYYIHLLFRQN